MSTSRLSKDQAYAILRAATGFVMGPAGASGTRSSGEEALRTLLALPTAATDVRRLLREARIGGRLYALLGLRWLADDDFAAELEPYLAKQEAVSTMHGCCVLSEPVSAIAACISKGWYDDPEGWEGGDVRPQRRGRRSDA